MTVLFWITDENEETHQIYSFAAASFCNWCFSLPSLALPSLYLEDTYSEVVWTNAPAPTMAPSSERCLQRFKSSLVTHGGMKATFLLNLSFEVLLFECESLVLISVRLCVHGGWSFLAEQQAFSSHLLKTWIFLFGDHTNGTSLQWCPLLCCICIGRPGESAFDSTFYYSMAISWKGCFVLWWYYFSGFTDVISALWKIILYDLFVVVIIAYFKVCCLPVLTLTFSYFVLKEYLPPSCNHGF